MLDCRCLRYTMHQSISNVIYGISREYNVIAYSYGRIDTDVINSKYIYSLTNA